VKAEKGAANHGNSYFISKSISLTVTGTLISIYFRLESFFFLGAPSHPRDALEGAFASTRATAQQLEPRHVIFLLNYILNEL
jgi:hypothetical protein